MKPQVTILPSYKIDIEKWDNCVANNAEGLVYATTNYLNFMAENWSGLVVDDYAAIMPLPWKKKLGIRYLYTPPFTQQLGFIGKIDITTTQLQQVLQQFVKYGDYLFNHQNNGFCESFIFSERSNYILNLNQPYHAINSSYKKSFKANLAKAIKQDLLYKTSDNFEYAIQLFQNYNQTKITHVSNCDFNNFKQLCSTLFNKNQLIIREVLDANKTLLCVIVSVKDSKRFYNLINHTSIKGRDIEANYFLYDSLLSEFAESPMIFDFEGSDLIGVKHFYKSFGAINQPYYQWHFNQLPWPLNWLKR